MEKKNTHIYIEREMGSSYTFLGPLICIRSKGEKKKSWSCHYCSLEISN